MARISRSTFDKDKNREKVIFQTGIPGVDADWNEQHDIMRNLIRELSSLLVGDSAVGDSFKVVESTADNTNNFKITGVTGHYVNGHFAYRDTDLEYKNSYVSEFCSVTSLSSNVVTAIHKGWVVDGLIGGTLTFTSGVLNGNTYNITDNTATSITLGTDVETAGALPNDRFTVEPPALTTPSGSNRTDEVYLHVWLEEISGNDDPTIIEPTIGKVQGDSLCRRLMVNWEVRVAEGGTTPTNTSLHFYVKLATLNRLDGNATITTAMLTDERNVISGGGAAINHNDTANIQGGASGEYFHLIQNDYDAVVNSSLTPTSANPFVTRDELTGYTGDWLGKFQDATNLPATADDKDLAFVENDSALYWWNEQGVDQGAPYYKWYVLINVSSQWHSSEHTSTFNDALAISADVGGNTTLSAHVSDSSIHATASADNVRLFSRKRSTGVFGNGTTLTALDTLVPAGTAQNGLILDLSGAITLGSDADARIFTPVSIRINGGSWLQLTTEAGRVSILDLRNYIGTASTDFYHSHRMILTNSTLALATNVVVPTINWSTDDVEVRIGPVDSVVNGNGSANWSSDQNLTVSVF